MREIKLHHNSQKRFYGKDKIYFITANTHNRFPYFREDLFCELFIKNLRFCKELKKFKLFGFIIIPDHAHLQLKPEGEFNISQIIQAIKRHFSRNVNLIIDEEGEICKSRLHLEAHDFNKKIIEYHNQFIQKYGPNQHKIPKFRWQQSFHDHVIRGEKDFNKHINYIARNCVKHKICEDEFKYKWSFLNPELKDLIDDLFGTKYGN